MPNFKELVLTKSQYNTLRAHPHRHGVMVFQSRYDIDSKEFNLVAYVMKKKHESIDPSDSNKFKELLLDTIPPPGTILLPQPIKSTDPPSTGHIVVGDLQVSMDDLEDLKKHSNSDPEKYEYFHFTSNYITATEHLSYIVQIVPCTLPGLTVKTLPIDPSPPATAR